VVFEADYDEIELQNIVYDIISVTSSSSLRHQNNVTKIFPIWAHQSKFLATHEILS